MIGKIILASVIGTGIEIIGLFVGDSYFLFLILIHVFEIPIMVWLVLGKEKQKMKVIVAAYFFVIIINGVLEILWNWFGKYGNYAFCLCAACWIVFMGVRIWKNYQKMQKGIFQVQIKHNGKNISNFGFYDSGNHLKDPYTGKGVHIISNHLLEKLDVSIDNKVCIPYHALGNAAGLLNVYYINTMQIYATDKVIEQQMIPVGVTEEKLFEGKIYEIILNEEVF